MPVRVPNAWEVYRADEPPACPGPLDQAFGGAIPIGPWSIGLDPLIGLIPCIGDLIGALISMVIVVRAVQAGSPRIAVARMMANITIDTVIGSIPLFRDAFDFAHVNNAPGTAPYGGSSHSTLTITNRTVPRAGLPPNLL
jgi:hypothetical protein